MTTVLFGPFGLPSADEIGAREAEELRRWWCAATMEAADSTAGAGELDAFDAIVMAEERYTATRWGLC